MSQSSGQENPASHPATPERQLTLFDSTSIIVGIIVGSSIYESTPTIAGGAGSPGILLAIWFLGGLISLIGGLCYTELATAYPHQGGDYAYLTLAYGRGMGFLFGWSQLWIVRPGTIGAVAYVFARYANHLWPIEGAPHPLMVYAAASVVFLTVINILGVREGKWTQNLLTVVKVLGLAGIVAIGFAYAHQGDSPRLQASPAPGLELALILVLYAYGGWNEMAYVSTEVKNPEKNILRALVLGTVLVTIIYVTVNWAFIHALGFEGTCASNAVAADVLSRVHGAWGPRAISLLICVTALGGLNGLIFTGARIFYAVGNDHKVCSWLAHWSVNHGTPVRALVAQSIITLGLVVGFGWQGEGGFSRLVSFTTPIYWIFFLLVGVSLFVLRYRDPDAVRPYLVPGYPVTPILFCLSSLFMVYASLSHAVRGRSYEALWSVAFLAVGVMVSLNEKR